MSEALLISIIEFGMKYGPAAARGIQVMFQKKDATQAEWDANVWDLAKVAWEDAKPSEILPPASAPVATTGIAPV